MRLVIFLLTAGSLTLSASTFSQTVTLRGEGLSLEHVFQAIQQQTGYRVAGNRALIKRAHPITVDAQAMPLTQFLDRVFDDQLLSYRIVEDNIILAEVMGTGDRSDAMPRVSENGSLLILAFPECRGKIVDSLGNPLSGATIRVLTVYGQRTELLTTTDRNGDFVLTNVPDDAMLEISYVGYAPRVVQAQAFIGIVVLQQATSALQEVEVSGGYYQVSQRYATGNIARIGAATIEKQPINNPILSLQGRIPGVMINQQSGFSAGGVKVQIRGQNSLNGGTEPLYVIDGLPVSSTVNRLFFANVINSSSDVSPSAFSYLNPSDIESIDVLKDADATAIYGSRGANGVILITTKKGSHGDTKFQVSVQNGISSVARKIQFLNTSDYLAMRREAFQNDGVAPTVINAPDLVLWDTTRFTDWQRELIGSNANYLDGQLSVRGGSQQLQYIISGNYHRETTVFPADFSDTKISTHTSLSSSTRNQVAKMNVSLTLLNGVNKLPTTDLTQFINLAPNAPELLTSDGELNWEAASPGQPGTWPSNNPMASTRNIFESRINNLILSGLGSVQISREFEFKTSFGYNYLTGKSYSANPMASIDPAYWPIAMRFSTFRSTSNTSLIVEPQIVFKKTNQFFQLEVLGGASGQLITSDLQDIQAYGFLSDNSMRNMNSATTFIPMNTSSQYRYIAVFGRASMRLKDKYLLNINMRRDGSSRFGPESQFANFGSIAAAWIFSTENFFKENAEFLSYGKLRASFGTTGSDQIPDYGYLERYNYTNLTYQGSRGLLTAGLYDPYFGWESTKKFEIGLETSYFNERLLLNFSYFNNRSSNQLASQPLPAYLGPGSITVNRDAFIENSGGELLLTVKPFESKTLNWESSLNFTAFKNRLLDYPIDPRNPSNALERIGNPLGYTPYFSVEGVDPQSGVFIFNLADGTTGTNPDQIDDKIRRRSVNFPLYFGGIQNSFTHRQWSFDFLVQFVKQYGFNYIFHGLPGNLLSGNQPVSLLDRWRQPGDIASIQRVSQATQNLESFDNIRLFSDYSYSDISYLRLRNVSLSYKIPRKLIGWDALDDCQIFFNGQNLLTISEYSGLDPESQSINTLPPLRVFTFGVKLTL